MDRPHAPVHRSCPDRVRRAALLGFVFLVTLGATGPSATGPSSFEGQGRITAIDVGRRTITIEHGGIAGLLPATRSEFPVADDSLIRAVRPGEQARFVLAARDESHGLLAIVRLTSETSTRWPLDRLLVIVVAALILSALVVGVSGGLGLYRSVQTLHRRVVALDHEVGMLRGPLDDTQDGIRQIARALEEAALTFRMGYVRELQRQVTRAAAPRSADESSRPAAESATAVVVVERGRGDLFHAVESGVAGPSCTVIWDRRRIERRANGRRPVSRERRQGERRAAPPETWTRLGFHVVNGRR